MNIPIMHDFWENDDGILFVRSYIRLSPAGVWLMVSMQPYQPREDNANALVEHNSDAI